MKRISNTEEMKGKVIKDFEFGYSANLVIVFTDDTFVCVQARNDYDDGMEIEFNLGIDRFQFPLTEGIRIGLFTAEEYETNYADQKKKHENRQLESERVQYEFLKKKFEGLTCISPMIEIQLTERQRDRLEQFIFEEHPNHEMFNSPIEIDCVGYYIAGIYHVRFKYDTPSNQLGTDWCRIKMVLIGDVVEDFKFV